jgi:hypothetical protein
MLQNYQNKRWTVEKWTIKTASEIYVIIVAAMSAIFIESSLGRTTQNTDCANLLGYILRSVSTTIPPSPSPFQGQVFTLLFCL